MASSCIVADIAYLLPPPDPKTNSSTEISVTLTMIPYLPSDDNWIYANKFKLMLYKKDEGEAGVIRSFEYSGALPMTSVAFGLEIFTEYCVFIQYYGFMKTSIQHNVFTSFATVKTGESGKCMTHYITLHYTTLHYITLHYITLHYITLHYIKLHCITLHYITLHYITLHYITLHYITLHYITLHYITLHYNTLHYIDFCHYVFFQFQ